METEGYKIKSRVDTERENIESSVDTKGEDTESNKLYAEIFRGK